MNVRLLPAIACVALTSAATAQSTFTAGNLVVLQTTTTTSKAASPATLKEFTTGGTAGLTVPVPSSGTTPFQTSGVYGGSEGFLTTSADGKYIVMAGYGTAGSYTDITATASNQVTRVIGTVAPSGFYLQVDTSTIFYSNNDIRGAVSDGTNFWASGASNASVDGINYFGPGTQAALATGTTPPKAYGLRIFNGNIYYSTQKSGPSNSSSQLGIFQLGTGMPTSGTVTTTQVINTGSATPTDFSFNAAGDVCYVAINANSATGGIQKWTRSGSTWTLAYTLGTGTASVGAYGLVVDYSGSVPVIYATTFETAGNRVIKIVDNGTLAGATITTLVAATSGTYYKGITFAPVASGTPVVNLTVSADTATEAGATTVIIKANSSFPVNSAQTVNIAVSGSGITSGDYTLSSATITIPAGATSGTDTFKVIDDVLAEGTETAVITMSAPTSGITLGIGTMRNITIIDNDVPAPPTIKVDTSTTNFIDGGIATAPASPFTVSGALSDPTDAAATQGINVDIATNQASGTLSLSAASSNTTVVPAANIVITGTGGTRNVKITPAAVGYSNITLTVHDGFDSSSYVIAYAASAASGTPAATFWHTGMSDGSDAIALDDNYFISGDDELDVLNVYSRSASGQPLVSFDYSTMLNLPDPTKPETDIEAATRSTAHTGRIYWLGSMSNGKAPFDNKPNRDRIFATNVTGTGASTAFSVVGYAALRSAILAWGDANGYNFTASAAAGVDSKSPSGFAAEGMVFGPDSTTLYVALRAPLVPTANRTKAVIVPINNFETWFNNGAPSGTPTFGSPIEMNLGGRGFRDIIRLSDGSYVIVAGNVGGGSITGALYKWTGHANDTPVHIISPASDTLNAEGAMEVHTGGQLSLSQLQIISDMGDDVLYNDGTAAKDFSTLPLRKFRSDMIFSLDLTSPTGIVTYNNASASELMVYPNPSDGIFNISFKTNTSEAYQLTVTDISGRISYEQSRNAVAGTNQSNVDLRNLSKGIYFIRVHAASFEYYQKLIVK
ncbi:T9SS type A sorting domain-containing protein [Chitinophagaceae bacterium MMS25-I14]